MTDVTTAPPYSTRLSWAAVGLAALAVLAVARWLQPDPSGLGTHTQLGLPPCGFLVLTRLPCPTCGLTTSFAHMARLQFTLAFAAHALGPVLFALTAVTAVLSAWGCATGMPFARTMERLRLVRAAVIIAAAAAVVWVVRIVAILST